MYINDYKEKVSDNYNHFCGYPEVLVLVQSNI